MFNFSIICIEDFELFLLHVLFFAFSKMRTERCIIKWIEDIRTILCSLDCCVDSCVIIWPVVIMRRAFDEEAAGLGGDGVMQLVFLIGGLFCCVLPWNLYRFHRFDLSVRTDDVKVLSKDQFEDNWMMVAFFVEAAALYRTERLPNRRQQFVLEGLRDQRGRLQNYLTCDVHWFAGGWLLFWRLKKFVAKCLWRA